MPKMQLQSSKGKKQGKKGQSHQGIIELIRPLNCFLASLATVAGFNLVAPLDMSALFAAISIFMITAAGNAVNDFFDIKRDKKNKPYRPLVSGKIEKGYAVAISIILFSIGLFFAYLVGIELFYLSIIASSALILYSGAIKEYKIFGNVIVSILVGFSFIAGSLAAGYWESGLSLAALAFVVNWSREILKDLEEKTPEKWTLSKVIGKQAASLTARGLLFWGILAAIIIATGFNLMKKFVFLLAIISWVSTIISYRKWKMGQKFIKIGMGLVILALLLPY